MNKLQGAKNRFDDTRLIAIEAYKLWKFKQNKPDLVYNEGYYLREYTKAWQDHQEASMALFLLEAEQ